MTAAVTMSPLVSHPSHTLPSPLNFEAYARAVNQLPFLDEARERELATAWHDRKDKLAAWELVMSHLRLVVRVVRDQAGYGLSPGDLAQEGTVGLMKAVHRFEPAKGIRLASYAIKWIEAEVREYIMRNWRLVRLGSGAAMKKLFFGYRQAVASLQSWGVDRDVAPSVQALAKELDLDDRQVAQAQAYFAGRDVGLTRDREGEDSQEERSGLQALAFGGATVADPAWAAEAADQETQRHQALAQALAQLPERDRAIVEARHLTATPLGLAELGERHGVSAERVRQIEKRALENLRKKMEPLTS